MKNYPQKSIEAHRVASKVYEFYKSYESLQDCLKEINNKIIENTKWAIKQKRKTNDGEKRYFKFSNCTKLLYLLIHPTDFGVSVFLQDVEHAHFDESDKIPIRTKDKVLQLYFEESKKTKEICRWLKQNLHQQFIELNLTQVNNLINRNKRKNKQQDPGHSIDSLKTWAKSSSILPENDDKMFVVAKFNIQPDDVSFRIFKTTKRLISNTIDTDNIATDAT